MIKDRKWDDLTRFEKQASVLWPMQVSPERRAEMAEIAGGENKRPPGQPERKPSVSKR
jgi:hypothetical protein